MSEVIERDYQRLLKVLSGYKNVEVFCNGGKGRNHINGGRVSVFLNYGKGFTTIEQKAKFADKMARVLGSADDYDAYETIIEMVWIGDKGIGGSNEPFIEIEIPIVGVASIVEILEEYEVEFAGNNI